MLLPNLHKVCDILKIVLGVFVLMLKGIYNLPLPTKDHVRNIYVTVLNIEPLL